MSPGYSPAYKVASGTPGRAGYSSEPPRKEYGPWKPWFAWRPVTTITGKSIWWCHIYRSVGNTYGDLTWYYYADEFDILSV